MNNPHQLLSPFHRKLLEKSLDANIRAEYRRRIEIMLMADEGYSQTKICERLGCSHETARYWITMAQSGNALRWSDRPMGRPKTVSDAYRTRLQELVSHSPREMGYPFRRWSAQWLAKHLEKELGIKVSSRYINYLLKEMGLSTRSSAQPSTPKAAPLAQTAGLGEEEDPRLVLLETG
ncbi:MAG: helix-turn-helix domain-containing protein [Oscillatoriales cyanobacterium C42_A2020_001]|nr:helix-turn-helix domain-containing protein [Leptolyngbyaceae cyanobacterium C42_A2020_001]